jgi:hypothetical protein
MEATVTRAVEVACEVAGRGAAELEAEIFERLEPDLSECPHIRRSRATDALLKRAKRSGRR